MSDLPKIVHIGPIDYRVKTNRAELFGETDNSQTVITLTARQSPPSMRDTLLHEVLHAALWCSGATHVLDLGDETEEHLIRFLAPWLLGVIRANPDLIDFLRESEAP